MADEGRRGPARRFSFGRSGGSGDAALRRWLPMLGVAGLLGVAALAAALSSPRVTKVPLPQPKGSFVPPTAQRPLPTAPDGPDGSGAADGGVRLPAWVTNLALALCLLIVIAIVLVVVWVVVRDTISVRKGALPVEDGASGLQARTDDVVAALDAGLAELSEMDRDPRRAVIACWVRLEQAAAAAGTPRQIGDAPADLVLRLLRSHRVDRRVLDRFADIYREARYATHVVDETMRTQALSALRQLRAELTAPAVAT
ncbi:MAG TPA: DUF4129 domain-containing protein [Micromonosporaceae bacterium]|jgi:hypothetical protein|nr:DUF4129 domain-containing protein [Micromonosporaceae bacterium]